MVARQPAVVFVETGNHIAQVKRDSHGRRAAAERFVALLEEVCKGVVPWRVNQVEWNPELLAVLCQGVATGQPLVDLLGNGQMGTGDVAILAERDEFSRRTKFPHVAIWTLEKTLAAHG